MVLLLLGWLFCLPSTLFNAPTSTVIKASNGSLIGARIAKDGQWRFPTLDSVPHRFKTAVLLFEDEYFYTHPGFNPISIVKAMHHNLTKNNRRGGSTITQQVIRLSRGQQSRTYLEKVKELIMATRLEWRYSKDDILNLYATHTPYGGNVVGLETASWRYFGLSAAELSWGQAATLAVLPNAPSLIFPGKNENVLLKKRNRLLKKLRDKGHIDQTTYELALMEPLPQKPLALPNNAPHLTERIRKEHPGKAVTTTLDVTLQRHCNQVASHHYHRLKNNEIHNLAILVLDVETRNVLAYVGNSPSGSEDSNFVDVIGKNRSTGSILKPLLFASLLDAGTILPNALVKDIPTVINGYNPKNFNKKYAGAVPASRALSRSLNVPAVRLLREYGLQKFYNGLKEMKISSLEKPANHYGLPLILGGAESSLWEMTQTYANLASTLNHFTANSSTYRSQEFQSPNYEANKHLDFGESQFEANHLNAGAIYHTFKAMREVNRPEGEENWQFFEDSQPLAWKTGTSFGFKDAWAIGVTPRFAIGVWVGNADGEGRPGLTGITAAAPVLFDVLNHLPYSGWFQEPLDDFTSLAVCTKSGLLASVYCEKSSAVLVPKNGAKSKPCPYHKVISLDATASFQVNASCYPLAEIQQKNWFILPSEIAYYYQEANPDYLSPPPYQLGCSAEERNIMTFLYPKKNEDIILPKDLGDQPYEVVFKLAHQQGNSTVFWYLDDAFIGRTKDIHELVFPISSGDYMLTAVDEAGHTISRQVGIQKASRAY
ncbi:penicillin-binding protein 1C [Croceitalea dokdonensis]|uniref:penicillin-binding protein 1C n=1 Tax=Croceitalea dokdonensis TaxID=346188 RepID=UPI0009F8C51F|nr:penicillin-binding protein 1C [Croceitalea dokdonensis]